MLKQILTHYLYLLSVRLGLLLSLIDATIMATMLLDITEDLSGFQKL